MWTMTYYFLFLFTCSYPIQLKFAIVVTVHWHLAYLTETGICQYITLLLVLPCCSNRVFSSTSHYQCLVVHSACISHYHYLVVQTACISHYQCLAVQTEYSAVYHITITLLFKQSIQQYITLPIPCCSNRVFSSISHYYYLIVQSIPQYITLLIPCCSNMVFTSISHYQYLVVQTGSLSRLWLDHGEKYQRGSPEGQPAEDVGTVGE